MQGKKQQMNKETKNLGGKNNKKIGEWKKNYKEKEKIRKT